MNIALAIARRWELYELGKASLQQQDLTEEEYKKAIDDLLTELRL